MKMILWSLIVLSPFVFTAPGCDDADGCQELARKVRSCNPTHLYVGCTDDAAAACTAEKLDDACSNLEAASQECANQ